MIAYWQLTPLGWTRNGTTRYYCTMDDLITAWYYRFWRGRWDATADAMRYYPV